MCPTKAAPPRHRRPCSCPNRGSQERPGVSVPTARSAPVALAIHAFRDGYHPLRICPSLPRSLYTTLDPLSAGPLLSLLGNRRRNPFATVTLRQLDMVLGSVAQCSCGLVFELSGCLELSVLRSVAPGQLLEAIGREDRQTVGLLGVPSRTTTTDTALPSHVPA